MRIFSPNLLHSKFSRLDIEFSTSLFPPFPHGQGFSTNVDIVLPSLSYLLDSQNDDGDQWNDDQNASQGSHKSNNAGRFTILSEPLLLPLVPEFTTGSTKLPRIVKSDVRRLFPMMLVNTLNSGDKTMMTSFLREYGNNLNPSAIASPRRLTLIQWDVTGKESPLILSGKEAIVTFWNSVTKHLVPDHMLNIDNIKLRTSFDGSCRLEFNFCFSGTKLFRDADMGYIGRNVTEKLQSDPSLALAGDDPSEDLIASPENQIQLFRYPNGELPAFKQSKIVITGVIYITVNAEKRIEKIERYGFPQIFEM
jgi:hypothetical protein